MLEVKHKQAWNNYHILHLLCRFKHDDVKVERAPFNID
jgi:hypothetical protein